MKSAPEFVYRLATVAEWERAQESGVVPQRDIDVKDGYMHLSTKEQALATATIHFAGVTDLLALEISLAGISDQMKFELAPKRGEEFPHLYDVLRASDVKQAISLTPVDDGFVFGDAL